MRTNRVVIVQCRLSSTRLPGKALKELGGKPLLSWCLNAMHKVKADRYFVATDDASYEQLLPVCKENDFECFSGDLNDVLKRFVDLLNTISCKTVIRATADNPFLFYEAAIDSVELFESKNKGKESLDYLTFSGLPHGSGVEVFSAASLKKAFTETDDPYEHEHVGPSLYNHKDKYKCLFVPSPLKYNYPQFRTTVDTFSDYLRAMAIADYLGEQAEAYSCEKILEALNSPAVQNPVILVPSVKKGQGTGHLRRTLNIALEKKYFVYIPKDKSLEECDSIIEEFAEMGLKKNHIISQLPDSSYNPIIISDNFELTKDEAETFYNSKALISIDDGSEYSSYCDYLLDIIPSCKINRNPNLFDVGFIERPEKFRGNNEENEDEDSDEPDDYVFSSILICFGGEDPAGFTKPTVKLFSKIFPDSTITAVSSALEEGSEKNIKFLHSIKNLKEELYKYDLVVTHYGLTAFEAAYTGCEVLLFPTTNLHKILAEKNHFAYISDKNITEKSLQKALHSEYLYPRVMLPRHAEKLSDFVETITRGKRLLCPVCRKLPSVPDSVISRNEKRTYRRCSTCGISYMSFTVEEDKKYQKSYFFEEYKKQYGKTYEEDFYSIKKQGLRRVEVIKTLSGNLEEKNLLDIGCAYGPFLNAADIYKMNPFGTDISESAVDYVQEILKYPAVISNFPDINTEEEFGISQFDVVTMWYVIEHFKNLDTVLIKVGKILKQNGIFAFSTPCGEGISAVSNLDKFYSNSPSDHYSVWEPSRANKILEKYGFKVEKIISTGHHPERFPSIQNSGAQKDSFQWKLIEKFSRIKNLGDTMEIYCKKIWS